MKIFSLLLSILTFGSQAQVVSVDRPELEAQRLNYESHLTQKIEKNLVNLVSEEAYVVNVSVRLKTLGVETVNLSAPTQGPLTERTKLEIKREFDGEEGLIPLSKLGVWSVDEPTQAPNQQPTSFQKRIRNFSELIRTIQIDILLDSDRVPEPKVRIVRQVIGTILRGRLPVAANLNIQSLKLETVAKEKDSLKKELLSEVNDQMQKLKKDVESSARTPASVTEKTTIDYLMDFKEVISILFVSMVLFFLGLLISQKYTNIQEKKIAVEESISMRQLDIPRAQKEAEGEGSQIVEMHAGGDNEDAKSGFDQFDEIINSQPERAAYMLKQWLYGDDKESNGILNFLPKVIPLNSLRSLLDLLSEEDRKKWNRVNKVDQGAINPKVLDRLIAQRISNHMIEPEIGIPESTRQLLAGITPREGVLCIRNDVEVGALLALTMSSIQYTRILSLLDQETIKKIAVASGQMDNKKMRYMGVKIEKMLNEIRQKAKSQSSVFLEKAPELIRDLGVGKESAIFESIAGMGQKEFLVEVSEQFFPAELISDLPQHIIRQALDGLSLPAKAELIASQEELAELFLEAAGRGKLKEILQVEVDQIESDDTRKGMILRQKDKKLQNFVNNVRRLIKEEQSVLLEVQPIIKSWADQMINRTGGQNAA